jgi:CheY-like chemotaxis protein
MSSGFKGSVLVVDDDEDIRHILSDILRAEGYASAAASDGKEALEFLGKHPPPSVILLDLMMPVMDGWEFSRRLRADERLSGIPVIVMSAHVSARQASSTLAAYAFLEKPLDMDRLLKLVGETC